MLWIECSLSILQLKGNMTDSSAGNSQRLIRVVLFQIGQLVATPGALAGIPPDEIQIALTRHQAGDWGVLEEHDRNANDHALENHGRLFSVYTSQACVRYYIITEHDRSVTTVLLPEEY